VSAFVCVQTIKSPDASRRKWISASGRVFCSRTFGMYYTWASHKKLAFIFRNITVSKFFGCIRHRRRFKISFHWIHALLERMLLVLRTPFC